MEWKLPEGRVLSLINIWIGWVSWCYVGVKYNTCCVSFWKLYCHTMGRKRNILPDSCVSSLHMLRSSFPLEEQSWGSPTWVVAAVSEPLPWPGGSCNSDAVLSEYHLKSVNVTGTLKAQNC